ncbi:hypothetical protein D3C81_1435990 [compost metagenome]
MTYQLGARACVKTHFGIEFCLNAPRIDISNILAINSAKWRSASDVAAYKLDIRSFMGVLQLCGKYIPDDCFAARGAMTFLIYHMVLFLYLSELCQ